MTATVEDKYHAPVGDGTLVTFATDLGSISSRSVTHDGVAIAHITTDSRGVALVTATTEGAGGAVQDTVTVTFGSWAYLPLAMRDHE